ncbi:MAG: orotidine-5'-phosphate decarboxylase [Silvibacterium sp.]|nr:orotidine-5'-phosphate decarboxylase [Silvibacterium sp.]
MRASALGARERLIVALDVPNGNQAMVLVQCLENLVQWFKVGLELYLAEGNSIVERIRERGHSVFLDLKLHDIPNTVSGAIRSVSASGAGMLTVHAAGGHAMLAAAQETAESMPAAPKLLAVTVLTSMDQAQLDATGVSGSPSEQVLRLAGLAYETGLRGFVAGSQEIPELRASYPDSTLVIPGIRPAGVQAGDQKRVATPASAMADGADYLVVGRPITKAPDPAAAAQAIIDEMEAAART